ncbi:hypothetical protein D3C86_1375400 [compost metagenome]|jgi:hypothetical protein
MASHVTEDLTGALILHAGTDRYLDGDIFATLAGTVTALAVLATFSTERFLKAVVDQRVEVFVRQQIDVAAIAAVTAIRAAVRDILFAAEADATITTVTCNDQNRCFIYKLHLPSP